MSGAPAGVKADPRYLVPYDNLAPTPYPAPVMGRPAPHGKGTPDEKPKERATERTTKRTRVRSREKSGEESTEEFHGKPSESVDGWVAARACSLFQKEGQLVVKFTGGGSSFHVRELKALKGGPFTLRFRMKSNALRKILVIYNKPSRDHLLKLSMKHDGRFHEYEVEIPVEALEGLRFNPAKAEGTIEVDWVRILDNTGKTARSWEF